MVLVGNPEEFHVGAHLRRAALALGFCVQLCDVREAFGGRRWLRQVNWRFRGHRPTRLRDFSRYVVETCRNFEPEYLIATGLAPIDISSLSEIGHMNVRRANFLTDDPWNPAHYAPWFLPTLEGYDRIFSPRRSNIEALRHHGARSVSYLPFAYSPEAHYCESALSEHERCIFNSELMFAGGADTDRLPAIRALIRAGLQPALYGGYWDRDKQTRRYHHGQADVGTLRKAIAGSRIALCLVRRSNRDGHVMRSFEIPAMGGCMLTEDTEEHRAIFGSEGQAVLYFASIPQMVEKARWLLDHEDERRRLASAACTRITAGHNTYEDRLTAMLA